VWVPAGDKKKLFFFRCDGEENLFKKVGYKKVVITGNYFF
jgi:hypothetical protein